MTKVNRVGETNIATNGQKMTIIAYRNYNDMDIQFEDRTIVYHKSYDKFKKGIIKNPNYNNLRYNFIDRIGETNIANNGQQMTIIAYRNSRDIDVQFENGSIVYNKTYSHFKRGEISYSPYNYINEKRKAKNGQMIKIIDYINANNITVEFEDGTTVYNKSYGNFKKGEIGNPNYKIMSGISCNEFAIYYYLTKYGFIKAEKGSLKSLGFGQMELDCYHPDYKIAIEYDGNLHATKQNNDKRKNKACKQNGITIIRIREPQCPVLNDNSIEYRINSDKRFSLNFEIVLKEVFKYINSITDLNIDENISFEHDKNIILKKFNNIYVNKYTKSRLGETIVASNGQEMTIIEYRGRKDIDVKFEDGTIVTNKTYDCFKKGYIKNPNYNENKKPYNFIDKTGEESIATNGQKMTIIAYRGWKDIDVKFEDETIVYHKDYGDFKRGYISNPNYKYVKYHDCNGEINIANNGQKMTIIKCNGCNNLTIQFEDGTIVYNKSYSNFKKGCIKNPNYNENKKPYNFIDKTGEENIATNGQKMTIIAYRGSHDIDVQFEDGIIVYNKNYNHFKTGNIKNPNYKAKRQPKQKINQNLLFKNRIGESINATNGQKMTIIAYRGWNDIDVQFEDSTIITNRRYDKFKKGSIKNPNFKKTA